MTHADIPHGLPTERNAGPFDPPREITTLRETRPVSPMVFPDGHEGWLVTGYEAVRRLMADTRFSSRQDLGVLHGLSVAVQEAKAASVAPARDARAGAVGPAQARGTGDDGGGGH